MKYKIAINGRFLTRRQTGQERFAKETIIELDKIASKGQYILVVPDETKEVMMLENIKIIRYGKHRSHLWEQLDFGPYSKRHSLLTLNLCTIQPLVNPGVVCIHDISYKINPQFFRTMYGRLSSIWHKINYSVAVKKSPLIFTVTENSKREIVKEYKVDNNKIVVVPNGWEHIERIKEDDAIFERITGLKRKKYYISIGSLMPNKNIKWVFDTAKYNSDCQFVIVGRASLREYGIIPDNIDNVILTGYVEDGELVSLIKECKALIFPSYYEGFGIPPLEALALGKDAIVANASCMPEIFKDCVHYIDPYNPHVKIQKILDTPVSAPDRLLNYYRYATTARIIHSSMEEFYK